MRVIKEKMVAHVLWVAVSSGKTTGHEITCTECDALYVTGSTRYNRFTQKPDCSRAVERETNPGLDEWVTARRIQEDRVYSNHATQDERLDLLNDIRVSLEEQAKRRSSRGMSESISTVISGVLMGMVVWVALCLATGSGCAYIVYPYVASAVLFFVLLYRAVVVSKRVYQRVVLHSLVQAFAPICPSAEELSVLRTRSPRRSYFRSIDLDTLARLIEADLETI